MRSHLLTPTLIAFLLSPGLAQAQITTSPVAPVMNESKALDQAVREAIRDLDKIGPERKFIELTLDNAFFPRDTEQLKQVFALPSALDFPRERDLVEDWFLAQVPDTFPPSLPDSPVRVLYLPKCRPQSWDFGDLDSDTPIPAAVVERGWIGEQIATLGLPDVTIPEFTSRTSTSYSRAEPDPAINSLNERLLDAASNAGQDPAIVVEPYCGELREPPRFPNQAVYPPSPPAPPPPPPTAAGLFYRIGGLAGFTAVYSAPFMQARVCELRFGSRFRVAGCPGWQAVATGEPLDALGGTRFRLIGKRGGTPVAFQYKVRSINLSDDGTSGQPVVLSEEE